MNLLLRQLRWYTPAIEGHGDVRVRRGRISEVGRGLAPRRGEHVLELADHCLLPGLINGHDHLALNHLPRLGSPPYTSFYRWAEEIHRPEEPPLCHLLRPRLEDRLRWGGYKNLISGVTTVVHHDPPAHRVFADGFPTRVATRHRGAHSLGYGGDVAKAHRRAGRRHFVIHAAEGTDDRAAREIDRLHELGVLGPRTVLIHAVAITSAQEELLRRTGTAVVWCPSSNLHLYQQTAPVARLKGQLPIALGTDSTLSGAPTLLDEMRVAKETGEASAEEIVEMVTRSAARIFGLKDRGDLRAGHAADLLVFPDSGGPPPETLLAQHPADLGLVLVGGQPQLASPTIAWRLDLGPANVSLDGRPRWVRGDLAALKVRIERATGRRPVRPNRLWHRIQPGPASRSEGGQEVPAEVGWKSPRLASGDTLRRLR